MDSTRASAAAMPVTGAPRAAWTLPRILLAIGAAGPALFLAVATVAGIASPSYDVMTQTMSELALGPQGWLMTGNFFVFGAMIIAFMLGMLTSLRRRTYVGSLLMLLVGVGIFASGVFPTDLKGAPETEAGALHNLIFLVVLLAQILAYPFYARALHKHQVGRGYVIATVLMPLAVFALLAVFVVLGSDPGDPLYAVAGLIQRALLAVAFGWMSVVGWRVLKVA